MSKRLPLTHLLAIAIALAALALGAFFYTNANEPVEGIPDAMFDGVPDDVAGPTACERAGGVWNECASACPPGTEACIQTCVAKCEGIGDGKFVVSLYFPNSKLGSDADCTKVFPVRRAIGYLPYDDPGPYYQLLDGPTEEEKSQGYFTAIPEGTRLLSDTERLGSDGVLEVTLDFSAEMRQAAGSCRVGAIRSQLEHLVRGETGKERVFVTIEGGSPDEALQP